EGLAARDKQKLRNEPHGLGNRCAHGCMGEPRSVRSLRALLHVWKLIAQRGDAPFAKPGCDRCHEWMGHAGPRAMREHVAGLRPRRYFQKAGDDVWVVDGDRDVACIRGTHVERYSTFTSFCRLR